MSVDTFRGHLGRCLRIISCVGAIKMVRQVTLALDWGLCGLDVCFSSYARPQAVTYNLRIPLLWNFV